MCDKNIIELLNIDFGSVNDEFQWVTTGSTPVETANGQLKLIPDDQSTAFNRGLGVLDANNDRVHLKVNLDLYRPQTSLDAEMDVVFGVYVGNTLIEQFKLSETLETGAVVTHHFERWFKYSELSGNVSLRITIPKGWNNQLFLDDLLVTNEKFCEDSVRTYFVFDEFFENAIGSTASAIQLTEWKVGGVETLTQDFFNENNSPGGDPSVDWLLAKANIDGSNRESNAGDPNTWNPFVSELGLEFENITGNFHGGKPTGITSGSDYGPGILNIGFSKPEILNGDLESKKGAFFIDIDFSQDLKVVFNVLVNDDNVNVFDSPEIYRKYTIEWDVETCSKKYYYQDQLSATPNTVIPDDINGFLSGITAGLSLTEIVGCDQSFAYNGNNGTFEFQIDFGIEVGEAGINYNALSIPDKFEIEWNGKKVTTGFVGSSSYNQQLLNLGIPQSDINTGNPSTGAGQLKFNKDSAQPSSAIVRVYAPFGSTGWNIQGICPNGTIQVNPTVDLSANKMDYAINESVTFSITANDDVGIDNWVINYGDGSSDSGTGQPPATIQHTYSTQGSKQATIVVYDAEGLNGSDSAKVNVINNNEFSITGDKTANCSSGMDGTIVVTSGFVTLMNESFFYSGSNPYIGGAEITINDGTNDVGSLLHQDTITVGPGTYTFTSGPVDCFNGSGVTTLKVL